MATDLSTPRSTNDLLLAATKGDAEVVEALYTHYQQFGTDVAAEHGCADPQSIFDRAFVEAMADSLDLSRGEPGSFATYLENLIQDLATAAETPRAPDPIEAVESDDVTDDESIEIDEPGEESAWTITATIPAADIGPASDEPAIEASATGDGTAPLGVLPLAATAARPRTPNQLLDRIHPRSLVTVIAAAFLLALITWVFLESTSSSSDGQTEAPSDTTPGAVTEPAE